MTELAIGYVPLTDAAPLIVAQEKGFFKKHGLAVTLSRENSWSQIRDKLATGVLDAAHMLAPMAPSSWLPGAYNAERFVTALAFNLNGNAITVSERLYNEMVEVDSDAMFERPTSARALRKVIADRITRDGETITIGAVFPFSSHNYALRYWLGAEGLNPERDVRMVVAPPPFMVDQLERGMIDAFCVGEPWNSWAEYRGSGRTIVRSGDIWQHMPEKILGVREDWAQENPDTHLSLVSAVLEALRWLDKREHRDEAAFLLAQGDYLNMPAMVLRPALSGKGALSSRRSIVETDEFLIFHHYAANFPWRSHALWFLTQMARWGQIEEPVNINDIAMGCYQPDVFRAAAASLGVAAPLTDSKFEGGRDRAWLLEEATSPIIMPAGGFIDGVPFYPGKADAYLEQFMRHNMRVNAMDCFKSSGSHDPKAPN